MNCDAPFFIKGVIHENACRLDSSRVLHLVKYICTHPNAQYIGGYHRILVVCLVRHQSYFWTEALENEGG